MVTSRIVAAAETIPVCHRPPGWEYVLVGAALGLLLWFALAIVILLVLSDRDRRRWN